MSGTTIAKYNLDDVKAIPIVDVARHLGLDVKRSGSSTLAHCFNGQAHAHGDRKPSLHLQDKTNRFLCYGCGAKGSVIDLVMQYKGLDFAGATAELGQAFNLPGRADPRTNRSATGPLARRSSNLGQRERSKFSRPAPWKPKPTDTAIYKRILELAPIDSKAVNYLRQQRGLTDQVIADYHLGHVIGSAQACRDILNNLLVDFRPEDLLHSGTVKAKDGTVKLAWWDRTLLIPFMDQDNIVYLQGRRKDDRLSKYVNLAGVPKPLYNTDRASSTPANDPVYICEGVFDALAIIAQGKPAVAVLGASVKDLETFRPLLDHPFIIARQNDPASRQWAGDIVKTLAKIGKRNVKALIVPAGFKDISDYLANQQTNKTAKGK